MKKRVRLVLNWSALPAAGLLAVGSSAMAEDVFSLCLAPVLPALRPEGIWQAWSLSPFTLLPLGVAMLCFARGDALLRARRRPPAREDGRIALSWLGWLLLAAALVSPLCRLAAVLVSAHMAQLMLLSVIAPGLIALARPLPAMREALPRSWRALIPPGLLRTDRVWPITAAYGALLWAWHVPAVYGAALTSAVWHVALYAATVLVSLAFWSAMLDPARSRIAAFGALFATMVHTGLLGAILTFTPRILYPMAGRGAADWGLSPSSDQQLAGLLMWVGGGVLYTAAPLGLAMLWLNELGRANNAQSAFRPAMRT